MSGYWLHAAIALVTIGLVNNFHYRILMGLCFILFYRHVLEKRARLITSLLIVLLLILSIPGNKKITQGRVVSLRNGYQIVSNGLTSVMIYSHDEDVCFDDIVKIDCELNEVNGYDNFEISTFVSWAKGQNIYCQGSIEKYEIIRSEFSLRRVIYQHNKTNGNEWINQLLFGNGMASESDYKYFFVASGMHVSLLAKWLRSYYGRRHYPLQAQLKTIKAICLLGLVFRFPYVFVRVLVNLTTDLLIDDRRDKTALRAILMVLYRPYYVKSVTFLVPFGLSFINLFAENRRNITARVYILLVQLYFYGSCNIMSTLFFSLARTCSALSYGLGLACCLMPFRIPLEGNIIAFLNILDEIKPFYINGRLSIIMLVMILKYLLDYVNGNDRKCLLMIVLLLLINNFQAAFVPFYTVSYLDVGQGDCSLITMPFSAHGLLIDTGGNIYKDVAGDIVVPYLGSRGISSVDVIISHEDYDHSGALPSLYKQFRVRNVYYKGNEEITINGLKILSPLFDERYEDANDDSQLSYFKIGAFGFLYLGDASQKVEEILVQKYQNLDVSVLKVSHHGSYTGTSDALLANYQIPIAVISAGRGNGYNHPSDSTMEKLDGYMVKVLCTKYEHAISFKVFSDFMIYQDADGKLGVHVSDILRESIVEFVKKMR